MEWLLVTSEWSGPSMACAMSGAWMERLSGAPDIADGRVGNRGHLDGVAISGIWLRPHQKRCHHGNNHGDHQAIRRGQAEPNLDVWGRLGMGKPTSQGANGHGQAQLPGGAWARAKPGACKALQVTMGTTMGRRRDACRRGAPSLAKCRRSRGSAWMDRQSIAPG